MATISNAVQYFSKGAVEARFVKHEGFVGALGALLDDEDHVYSSDCETHSCGAFDPQRAGVPGDTSSSSELPANVP